MDAKDIQNKIKGLYKDVEPDHFLADDERILSYEQRGLNHKERHAYDTEFRDRWQKNNKARYDNPAFVEKQKKSLWNNKDVHDKRKKSLSKTWQKPDVLERARKNTAERWQDPEFVKKVTINRTKANKTPEAKANRRKAEKKKWADRDKKEAILRKSGQAKPIASDGGIFLSLSEAAEFHNMSLGRVRERILGIVKTNEHNFRYITWDEYDAKKVDKD